MDHYISDSFHLFVMIRNTCSCGSALHFHSSQFSLAHVIPPYISRLFTYVLMLYLSYILSGLNLPLVFFFLSRNFTIFILSFIQCFVYLCHALLLIKSVRWYNTVYNVIYCYTILFYSGLFNFVI